MSVAYSICKICGTAHPLGYCPIANRAPPDPRPHETYQARLEQAPKESRGIVPQGQRYQDEKAAEACPHCDEQRRVTEHYRAEIERLRRELLMLQSKVDADVALASSDHKKGSRKEYMREYMQKRRKK